VYSSVILKEETVQMLEIVAAKETTSPECEDFVASIIHKGDYAYVLVLEIRRCSRM
jgi:hypothetical protein